MNDVKGSSLVYEPFKYPRALKRAPRGILAYFFAGLSAAFILGALEMLSWKWMPSFVFPLITSLVLLFAAERSAWVSCMVEAPKIRPPNFLVALGFLHFGNSLVDALGFPLMEVRWALSGLEWIMMGSAMRLTLHLHEENLGKALANGFADLRRNGWTVAMSGALAAAVEWVFLQPFIYVFAPGYGVNYVVLLARFAFRLAILPVFFAGYWKIGKK